MQALAAIAIVIPLAVLGAGAGALGAQVFNEGPDDLGFGAALYGLVGAGVGGVAGAVSGAVIYAEFVA